MKNTKVNVIIFVLAAFCLVISMRNFYYVGIMADELSSSPDELLGGEIWLYADWLQLFANAVLCVIPLVNIVKYRDE